MTATAAGRSVWSLLTAADRALILLVALGALGLFVYQGQTTQQGRRLRIQAVDQVQRIELDQDRIIQVKGPLGVSRIEIAAAGARFGQSPCAHQICVKQGWIRLAGEVAACIPNRVILAVQGAADDGPDAVSR